MCRQYPIFSTTCRPVCFGRRTTAPTPPGGHRADTGAIAATSNASMRLLHAENVLTDIGEDQVGRDRGGLVEADLAPFALDVVFAGKGKAAIGRHRRLGGVPPRFGRQELR